MAGVEADLQTKVVYQGMTTEGLVDLARAFLGDLESATRDATARLAGRRLLLIVEELARRTSPTPQGEQVASEAGSTHQPTEPRA